MNPIDALKNLLTPGLLEKIGGVVGLQAPQVSHALDSILPLQLQAMIHKSETPEGSRDLFHTLEQSAPLADVNGVFSRPDGVQTLMKSGEGMLGSLFGGRLEGILGALSRFTGFGGGALSSLMKLAGPLLGGVLGGQMLKQGVGAGGLGGWLGSMKGMVGALLPSGLTNLLSGGSAALGAVGAGVGAIGAAGVAGASTLGNMAGGPSTGAVGTRAVGAAVPPSSVTTPSLQGQPVQGQPVPQPREEERRGGVSWLWPVVGLLAVGGLAYWFFNQNNATAPAVSTTSSTSSPTDTSSTSGTDTSGTASSDSSMDTSSTSGTASSGELKITEPAGGEVPAGAFTLKGTGTAGEVVEGLEDGTSVGKATVGADGTWNLNIPSPAAGARNYEVKAGATTATLALNVAASSGAAADCTKDFTLSVADGSSVTQPFRFGGEGKGSAYVVTVKRGGRTVGTKEIALDGSCGWSYRSNPGKGPITYEVSEKDSTEIASTVNLTVQ